MARIFLLILSELCEAFQEHLGKHRGQEKAHEPLAGDDAALSEYFVQECG